MIVLIENAYELEVIAASAAVDDEIGPHFLEGHLRYPSETGGWSLSTAEALGDLDLDEYLAKFRDRQLVLMIAPVSDAEPTSSVCGICDFVMNEAGECPRCKLEIAERAREIVATGEDRDVASPVGDGDQVRDWLDSEAGAA